MNGNPRRIRFDIRQQGLPILLLLGAVILLNVAGWAIFVRPKASEYADRVGGGERVRAIDEFRDKVVRAEEYLEGLGQAERDLEHLRTRELGTRGERMVEIERELVRLCREFRISLDTVSYKNETLREEGLDRFAMIVPLEGGYANLRRFLQAVEAAEQFMVVERVALAEDKGAQAGSLQLNITIGSYFHLDGPAAEVPARGEERDRA